MGAKRNLLMVMGLALLALLLIVGSTFAALSGRSSSLILGTTTALPKTLFLREPGDSKIAPVDQQIASEVASAEVQAAPQPTSSAVTAPTRKTQAAAASPSPTVVQTAPPPTSTQKASPIPGATASPSPTPQMTLDLSGRAKRTGGTSTITYTSNLKNTGTVSVNGVSFTSHVPSGTVWNLSPDCGNKGFAVYVTYSTGTKETLCVPGTAPSSGNGDAHTVSVALTKTVDPGVTATMTFALDVTDSSLTEVSNHAHAAFAGVTVDSPVFITRIR